jgi:hypothetical protein
MVAGARVNALALAMPLPALSEPPICLYLCHWAAAVRALLVFGMRRLPFCAGNAVPRSVPGGLSRLLRAAEPSSIYVYDARAWLWSRRWNTWR